MPYQKSYGQKWFMLLSIFSTLILLLILTFALMILFSFLYYFSKKYLNHLFQYFSPYILNKTVLEYSLFPLSLIIFPFSITLIKKWNFIKLIHICLIERFLTHSMHDNSTYSSLEDQEFKKSKLYDYIFIIAFFFFSFFLFSFFQNPHKIFLYI